VAERTWQNQNAALRTLVAFTFPVCPFYYTLLISESMQVIQQPDVFGWHFHSRSGSLSYEEDSITTGFLRMPRLSISHSTVSPWRR
jgi:hypothetical protein